MLPREVVAIPRDGDSDILPVNGDSDVSELGAGWRINDQYLAVWSCRIE